MTEIEKAVEDYNACRCDEHQRKRAALLSAITRREAEARNAAIKEVLDLMEERQSRMPLRALEKEIRALIKEQP